MISINQDIKNLHDIFELFLKVTEERMMNRE